MVQDSSLSRLVYKQSEPIGMVCTLLSPSSSLYITSLGCLVLHRNQGVGKTCLDWAVDRALHAGVDHIELHVQEINSEAVRFYQRFGFEVVERVERMYRYLKSPAALLMVRKL